MSVDCLHSDDTARPTARPAEVTSNNPAIFPHKLPSRPERSPFVFNPAANPNPFFSNPASKATPSVPGRKGLIMRTPRDQAAKQPRHLNKEYERKRQAEAAPSSSEPPWNRQNLSGSPRGAYSGSSALPCHSSFQQPASSIPSFPMMSIPPTSFSPSRPYGRRATSPVAISATAAALSPPSLEASPSELHKKIAQLQAELEEKNKELHQARLIIAGRDNTIREKCRIIGEEQDRLAVLEEKMRSIRQIMDSHEHIGSDSESSIGVDMELH